MKIVVFGTGAFYRKRASILKQTSDIICFLDNNKELWGQKIDGREIYPPEQIRCISYDRIVLMSLKAYEMKAQLLRSGVDREKIYSYEEHVGDMERGEFHIFYGKKSKRNNSAEKVLILSVELGYTGGTIVAVYAAMALIDRGYEVVLGAPRGDKDFIDEALGMGVDIILYGILAFAKGDELLWINDFDKVIVNTFQMINCACVVSRLKPTYWWLHESLIVYEWILGGCDAEKIEDFSKISIYAVSDVAKKNFQEYYPDIKIGSLPYGIPDKMTSVDYKRRKDKLIFAIIGNVVEIKGHDVLLGAISKLSMEEKRDSEFWIIGRSVDGGPFDEKIKRMAGAEIHVKIIGQLDRKSIEEIYPQIDVVVNPSRQDSLPTVVAEGMMYGKVCITTNVTGMAQYIHDGENGFVCDVESVDALCEKIRWIISNKDKLSEIGGNARKTYITYFTMDKFGERLENILYEEPVLEFSV